MPTRTIRIPVAEVLETPNGDLGSSVNKSAFYQDLRDTLDLSRKAANMSLNECLRQDTALYTGEKCPRLYTYPAVSSQFPGVAVVAASVARAVEKKYKQERWQIATGRRSASSYRSWPWPLLHNKSSKMMRVHLDGEVATVDIKLLGGWYTVRLAGGSNYRMQHKGLQGAVKIGDSKIWINHKHQATLGISAEIPQQNLNRTNGTLEVSSSRDAFIVATKAKNDIPFVITGDKVRKWANERDRKYQRLRQDRKSGTARKRMDGVLDTVSRKWKHRMDSFVHESTAQIVAHARRRKCDTIRLDCTIKSWLPRFPWFDLATKLKYKCEDAGINFVDATMAVQEPDLSKPHVYFTLSPTLQAIKIGMTKATDGSRSVDQHRTSNPDDLIVLAIDNQPKSKLRNREKHYHAYFAEARLDAYREWFREEPVLAWLRDVGWLGNAGNLSQIAQVREV